MELFIVYLVLFIILFIFIKLLPFLFPILIILYILSLIFGWKLRKNVHTYTFTDEQDYQQTSTPKNDAIDVEYTETEEEDND